jgi:hypothetical protein
MSDPATVDDRVLQSQGGVAGLVASRDPASIPQFAIRQTLSRSALKPIRGDWTK